MSFTGHPQDPALRQDINSQLRDRNFSERARLNFSFSNNNSKKITPFTVKIPIYENPTITESKQARLGKYRPIGRNSNLYSYLGADSTSLNLSFHMTLPHIVSHAKDSSLSKYFERLTEEVGESSYSLKGNDSSNSLLPESISNIINVIKGYEAKYLKDTKPEGLPFESVPDQSALAVRQRQGLPLAPPPNVLENIEDTTTDFIDTRDSRTVALSDLATKARILIYFWTNVIRCSVIGSSDHSSPPPIVRLSFGAFYKQVPFIVEKYQISVDEKAGYDTLTLLPRRIKISLTMEELRTGNYSKFIPYNFQSGAETGNLASSENVAGWDHVIETGSIQPLYYPNN